MGRVGTPFRRPHPLGVGCSLFPSLPRVLDEVGDLVDCVEVSPDTLCRETLEAGAWSRRGGGGHSMAFVPDLLAGALDAIDGLPVIVHGVELSIGSADGWNESYLDVLDQFDARQPMVWHSEHIGFLFAGRGNSRRHAGVPLPMPFTREAVDLVAARATAMAARFPVPFLLENAAYYLPDLPADPGWDEATFLTELVAESPCGLLLDLHNLWVNATNHRLDVYDLLERIPLDRVVEIHVAGGDEADGFVLDSHSGAVPEPVWSLLECVLPRAPHVCAVVFEALESHFPRIGVPMMRDQLTRLRETWDCRRLELVR